MSLLQPLRPLNELLAERDSRLIRSVIVANLTALVAVVLIVAVLLQGGDTQKIERQTQCFVVRKPQCIRQVVTVPSPTPVPSPYPVDRPVVIPSPLTEYVPFPVPGPTRIVVQPTPVPVPPSPAASPAAGPPPLIGCLINCPPGARNQRSTAK